MESANSFLRRKGPGSRRGVVIGVAMRLSDERFQRDMLDLTNDLLTLLEAKYPRLSNAFQDLEEEEMIELMIELCDIFDLYRELNAEVARLYQEHRRKTGTLEDRDWPEN